MKTYIYCVMNAQTHERVYTNSNLFKVREYLENMEDRESYRIGYKWVSF